MIRPQWEWAFDGADGVALDRPVSPAFANQYDAEEWIGEVWRDLSAQGVRVARLLNGGAQAAPALVVPPLDGNHRSS
ncbi:hypothetical protein [Cellulomonas sp. P24]|uniref:hypothetical protein n=1 Tax=Cellulomonas sp. P24 TaxID=2885206 RepID=UPI00216AD5ED|nr:hypothetical protein [Cellulomonas sp. P24]MCR6494193.1 hypothetical protein [Cellulomonas sp. P24]